jgi:NAD(P)-dependent dehydrogenase (short-subunit alcohol dehydrogenase family)
MTENSWSGTAVVTGAGSGLGAAMVERLAAVGMSVMALDIDGERAEQTAQAVRNAGGKAKAVFPAGMRTRHLESSARARPSDIGQWTMMPDDIKAMKESRKLDEAAHVVTAEHATRNLLQELAENRRYIVTHGNYRDAFAERFDDILAALERARE